MTTGLYGTENIAEGLQTVVDVVADIKKAKEAETPGGKKITPLEWLGLAVGNVGKLYKFANSIDEIGDEVADLEAKESPELCVAIEQLYSPQNPFIKSGAEKLVTGVLWQKEGIEDILKAKQWETENA